MSVKLEHRLGIKTPARVVWEIISDINSWREWNPLHTEAKGVIGFGERLTMTQVLPGAKPQTIRPVVLDWAPDEAIHWRMSMMGGLLTSIRYLEIEKMHEAGCIFSNGELFEGLMLTAIGRRTRRQIREGFAAMGEAVRDRAEARWRATLGEPT